MGQHCAIAASAGLGTAKLDSFPLRNDASLVRILIAIALVLLVGCEPGDPVTTNRVMEPGDELAVRQLTPAEDRAALNAMRSVVGGDVERPTPARYGMRFDDVPEAVRLACNEVDMAILRKSESPDHNTWTFQLVTIRDEPGEMIVERRDAPEIVSAHATVGSFKQRERDAKALIEEFYRQLRALGAKPGWE
jgi:hypothetical protein